MAKPMKTRARRPAPGAVADFAATKADKQEIAASRDGRDITRGWLYPLQLAPVDDTVLLERGGGDYRTYDEVIRDDTVRAAVNQRVHGVIARPWVVRPGGKRAIDKAAADFLQGELDALQWDNVTAQMLSGVFYGFSVAEVIWRADGGKVGIADIRVRNRRRFGFDGESRLRLKTLENPWPGELLPERKFWVARFGADHFDAPYGLGLAHYLYWPVWMKRNALRFWAVYLEKFGTPTVLGRYPGGTSEEEQNKLLAALQAVVRDSTVILPEGMAAELLEATRAGTADHAGFITAMDKAILKVTLGQTATVEGTAGKLGNDSERRDVKDAILKADADMLSASFCDSVAAWLTEWNFPGAAVPQVWRVFDDEDLDRRIVRDKTIFDMGFVPSLKYLTETYGGEWQEKPKPEPVDRNNPTGEPVAKPLANHAETSGSPIHAEPKDADPTPVTAQVAQMQAEARIAWEEILERVQALADEAESLEALRERLLSAYGDLPTDELAEIMAMGFAAADLAGRLDVKEESGDGR